MTLVLRENSKNWYMQFQVEGRTYIRSSRTTDRKVAERMEVEWKASIHAQRHLGVKPRISLAASMEAFAESKRGTPNYRPLSAQVRVVLRYINSARFIDQLGPQDLERFKQVRLSEGASPQTVKHGLNAIIGALKLARKLGYDAPDIVPPEVKIPKRPLRYLSVDEERRLLKALDPERSGKGLPPVAERSPLLQAQMQDAYDLVILLLDTGARYSEIANIAWTRINLVDRTIDLWRSKVENETALFMSERVHAVLLRRRATSSGEFVFQNSRGGPRGYASMAIRKAIKRAGLKDCRIHTLRHTHASRLIQNGMSVYEVKEILGHSDIKTTMRYAHLESRAVAAKARDVIDRLASA